MSNKNIQQSKITVEKNNVIGRIGQNLFGAFLEHVGRAIYTGIYEPEHPTANKDGFRTDVIELVKELHVSIVRYPGGNFVSGYHWQDGIGNKADRPQRLDLAWHATETNQVGIDDFAVWAESVGTDVMPTVNMGTGTPQDAAYLVEYCNHPSGTYYSDMRVRNGRKEPYRFKHWCIGNEMDGGWQIGHLTAEEYGRKARESAKIMKMVDNSIQVTVAGSATPEMPTFPEWDRVVLEHTYDLADYISIHRYYGYNEKVVTQKDYLHSYLDLENFIHSVVATADYVKALKRSSKTMLLSLDEWNVWHSHSDRKIDTWDSAPHILENNYSLRDALVFSGMMLTMINNADRLKMGCLAQLVNAIAPILTKTGGETLKQTIYYPYMTGCAYAKGEALKVTVSADSYETVYGDAKAVYAAFSHNAQTGEGTLFLLNTSGEENEVTFNLSGFGKLTLVERLEFGGQADLDVKNTFETPSSAVMRSFIEQKPLTQDYRVVLPQYSFNVFRVKEAF